MHPKYTHTKRMIYTDCILQLFFIRNTTASTGEHSSFSFASCSQLSNEMLGSVACMKCQRAWFAEHKQQTARPSTVLVKRSNKWNLYAISPSEEPAS